MAISTTSVQLSTGMYQSLAMLSATRLPITPPTAPMRVFLGLISCHSFAGQKRPPKRPKKYANVSDTQALVRQM